MKGKKLNYDMRPEGLGNDASIRWIPGYEGSYAVTDNGALYSYLSGSAHKMKFYEDKDGYLQTILSLNGERNRWFAHRMVLCAFTDESGEGLVTRHLNGDRQDNRIQNLEWGSVKENSKDSFRHGTSGNKVSKSDVKAMRVKHISEGEALGDIMDEYGISSPTASMIMTGRRWPDAGGPTREPQIQYSKGESHGNSKLTRNDVIEIRQLNDNGLSYAEIAESYPVSRTTIGRICRMQAWGHVG